MALTRDRDRTREREGTLPPDETYEMIGPGHNFETVTEKISSIVLSKRISFVWLVLVIVFAHVAGLFGAAAAADMLFGIGFWGNNIPNAWAFDIINFVWWIGIGHAGTLISAILLLLHQNWRTSINRFAEAMTLFAVFCAAQYPLLHIGRHMYAYWMFPLPNSMGLWPQFRSPLIWDVFAINTYLLVSALFWYVGLIPDLATLRDRSRTKGLKVIFGMLAMGWRGSALHWRRYTQLYLLLAGLSTPLVLSVHSIVSYDFAFSQVPGWHSTIFPPYFVAGAVFAGFAMVLILAIPLRAAFGLKDLITMKHLENCAKVMLATGMIVVYGYIMEVFFGWYTGSDYERYMTFTTRMGVQINPMRFDFSESPYAWSWYALLLCNGLSIQLLWFKKFRTNLAVLFIVSLFVSVGMWLERFVIIVTSLARDYLPSAWANYNPTIWDWMLYIGSIGLFFTLFLLFIRVLPTISIAEMRELVAHEGHGAASFTEHEGELADARISPHEPAAHPPAAGPAHP